jgi:hypothetical protein
MQQAAFANFNPVPPVETCQVTDRVRPRRLCRSVLEEEPAAST